MCDLNWCPVCDRSISVESDFLYCSVDCFLKDNNSTKELELTDKFNGFLRPKTHSISTHLFHPYDNIQKTSTVKISGSLPTMTTSATIESLLSSKDETDDEDDKHFLSCCDYCENKMGKDWNMSKSFQEVCPSYNPLWSEEMPGMDGQHYEHVEESIF